jgi:tRNA(Ile)-lysidine synthetase-like protein
VLSFGENIFLQGRYRILITDDINEANSFTNVYKSAIMTKVKSGKITLDGKCDVTVRTKKTGDSYVFGKMSRNVRKQLVNYKIPAQKREHLPVFCVNGEIFMVHGLPIADGYAPKKDDKITYIVCVEEN